MLPGIVPGSFIKCFVCFCSFTLELETDPKIVVRLSIIRIWISGSNGLDGCFEKAGSLFKLSTPQQREPHGIVATAIVWFTAQCLFIVIRGTVRGMTILLDVKAIEVQLLYGRYVGRIFSSSCSRRQPAFFALCQLIIYQQHTGCTHNFYFQLMWKINTVCFKTGFKNRRRR